MNLERTRERAELHLSLSWPYDDAVRWMDATRARVLAGGAMAIGVGAHDREVVTLGRNTAASDVLAPDQLDMRGAQLVRIERGGGATAHGPGQIVCYPIIHLERLGLDVPALTSALELSVVDVLRDLGVDALPGGEERGVYVGEAKIASVGFRVVKGVVTHGLALNVENDLGIFDLIATCGRARRPMTSVAQCMGERAHGAGFPRTDSGQVARALARRVASRCMLELPA